MGENTKVHSHNDFLVTNYQELYRLVRGKRSRINEPIYWYQRKPFPDPLSVMNEHPYKVPERRIPGTVEGPVVQGLHF